MKIERVYEHYKVSEGVFECPACHTGMRIHKPASLICLHGHCYDLSGHGYVNFLPNQKPTKYDKKLFESRRRVFQAGYYDILAKEICRQSEKLLTGRKEPCIVDAGCGEGYYDCFLQQQLNESRIYAFDNVKEAVRMGAKSDPNIRWLVANLAQIPLKQECADLLLEIFAPSNYGEFRRILKQDGFFLKVIPGAGYLKEIR